MPHKRRDGELRKLGIVLPEGGSLGNLGRARNSKIIHNCDSCFIFGLPVLAYAAYIKLMFHV